MSTIQASHQAMKAAQALNFLIQESKGDSSSVDGSRVLKLVKLLWAADRYSLRSLGDTVTGDRYAALRYGPVASNTYSLMCSTTPGNKTDKYTNQTDAVAWRELFLNHSTNLVVIGDPGDDDLSPADVMMLEKAYSNFRGTARFDMADDISHRYPEWARLGDYVTRYNTSQPIDMTDFFRDPDGEDLYFHEDPEVLEAARFFYDERILMSQETGIIL